MISYKTSTTPIYDIIIDYNITEDVQCEYCHPPYKNLIKGEQNVFLMTTKRNNYLVSAEDTLDSIQTAKINFCPMCGREL
jgi:hypothetical protein